jgi:hypothetical protein
MMPFCASVTTGTVISGRSMFLFGTRPKVSPQCSPAPAKAIAVNHRFHQVGGVVFFAKREQRIKHRAAGLIAQRFEVTPEKRAPGAPG